MNSAEFQSEDGLLRLCSMGDEKSWGYFVERYSSLVRKAIRDKITRTLHSFDENDIDDIYQQTFIRIWRNNPLKDIKNPRSVSAWLVIVAQNCATDFLRKKKRLLGFCPTSEFSSKTFSSLDNPRTEAHHNQMYEMVEELIEALPLKERRIMVLELFYDLKHREIAAIMSIPINTISTIVARIKERFRDKLKKRGYDV